MKPLTKRLLFWTPRVLCLLFAGFISLFALDVFNEHHGFWKITLALLIHLVPTYLVLGVLLLSWRREWVGAALFTGLGAYYLDSTWGRFHWSAYLCISGPLFLLGALFLVNWPFRAELRARQPEPS